MWGHFLDPGYGSPHCPIVASVYVCVCVCVCVYVCERECIESQQDSINYILIRIIIGYILLNE